MHCPQCGAIGSVVGNGTIRNVLDPRHASALLAVEQRFCRMPTCDVLYYGADGQCVGKSAAVVRVGLKEIADPIPLCYCFGFTRADIASEVAQKGDSDVPARITAEVRAGRCRCETANPSGTCCLGVVRKAVKAAQDSMALRQFPSDAAARSVDKE
jgi:hypothetical protein